METKLGDVQTFYSPLEPIYTLCFSPPPTMTTLEFSSGLADFIAMPLNTHQTIQNTQKEV